MFSSIMIPVDLRHTDRMEKALSIAADISKTYGAPAHIVGVTSSAPTEIAHNPKEFAEKLSEFAAGCSQKHGATFTPHAEVSHDPAVDLDDTLARAAEDLGADLIVMASHVPGLAEYVFASNAGYLASHSSISVFVVR